MWYVALESVEQHIERVKRRAARGGHSASETTLRRIHASSLANLRLALSPEMSGIEIVRIYDNSRFEDRPMLVLAARGGKVVWLRGRFPDWLQEALGWSQRELEDRRRDLMR
jgi:predicted ABC-type ATPase